MIRRSQYARIGALLAAATVAGCGRSASDSAGTSATGPFRIVAVERVYGDVAAQLGGKAVSVTTILDSPSADPHAYEPTTADADAVANADLVIENGLGYDAFADKLLAASPKAGRTTLVVGTIGGHRTGDNPHVWYDAHTLGALLPALVRAIGSHASPGAPQRAQRLEAWVAGFAARTRAVGARHRGRAVAITEPVFDYVLDAAGLTVATPPAFSHAIEEGNDPAPQDLDTMNRLLATRAVAAFVYNKQTQEPSTVHLLDVARSAGVGIVPVTETLPAGLTTQDWIDGEVSALDRTL